MKKFVLWTITCFAAVLLTSCADLNAPGKGIPTSVIKQGGNTMLVQVPPGFALSPGTAIEAFHRAAQDSLPAGSYHYQNLDLLKHHHTRLSGHNMVSPYGANPESSMAAMFINLYQISKDQPPTYSISSYTANQKPLRISSGTEIQLKISRSKNSVENISPEDLSLMKKVITAALQDCGFKVSNGSTTNLEVELLRAAKGSDWVSLELALKKQNSPQTVKAFLMPHARIHHPEDGQTVSLIKKALREMIEFK